MDQIVAEHKNLAAGKWAEMPFCLQMGNIGSEVSRAIKWHGSDKTKRFQGAFQRALELFVLTIDSIDPAETGKLKEVCRAREEFCDLFLGHKFHSSPDQIQKYYDQFVSLKR